MRSYLGQSLVVLGLAWCGTAAAQDNMFRSPPAQIGSLPASRTQAVMQSTAPASPGYIPSVPIQPGYPTYPGYGYGGYYPGVAGGYLQGQASVISSQGQFAINQQQA